MSQTQKSVDQVVVASFVTMCDNISGMSTKEQVKGCVLVLLKEHRTIQAGVIRFLLSILCEYATECSDKVTHGDVSWRKASAMRSDGRNEAAVEAAMQVLQLQEDNQLGIPYI